MCVCVCVCVCVCKEARAHVHLWNSCDFSNVPEQIVEATLDLGKNMLFRDVIANLQDGAGSSCLLEFMPLCSRHFLCSTRTRLCDQETISEVMMVCHFYIQIIKGFIKTTVASILSRPPHPLGYSRWEKPVAELSVSRYRSPWEEEPKLSSCSHRVSWK